MDGKRFSLCLASRVGDNRYGNENCFFADGRLYKLGSITVRGNPKRLERAFSFRSSTTADITFKAFTVRGTAMTAAMAGETVVFGSIYGELHHTDLPRPLVFDSAQAHMIFSEF